MRALVHASVASLLGLLISALPLVAAVIFVVRPDERKRAIVAPLSMAGILASVASLVLAVINAAVGVSRAPSGQDPLRFTAIGFAEGLVPPFGGFVLVAAAWLLIAIGMRRRG